MARKLWLSGALAVTLIVGPAGAQGLLGALVGVKLPYVFVKFKAADTVSARSTVRGSDYSGDALRNLVNALAQAAEKQGKAGVKITKGKCFGMVMGTARVPMTVTCKADAVLGDATPSVTQTSGKLDGASFMVNDVLKPGAPRIDVDWQGKP